MRFTKTIELHKGESRPISRGYGQIIDNAPTTLTAVVAQNVDSGITITDEVTSTPLYSATLNTTQVGRYTFEIKATFANGYIDISEFQVIVQDPEVRR